MEKIVVIGAKGLAKEVLFSFPERKDEFIFYDDINPENKVFLNRFPVLKNVSDLKELFPAGFKFIIGVGGAKYREQLFNSFQKFGGRPETLISSRAKIGEFENTIGSGSLVMDGALITNTVKIGNGVLVNKAVIISHDVEIGDFCDISPGARIMGWVRIGNNVEIGTNACIIPKIKIGNHVTIGAGSVVINDIPDFATAVGNPARIIRIKDRNE